MKANNLHDIEVLFDDLFGPKGTEHRDTIESNAQVFAIYQMLPLGD